jgi:hypothetical protein
MNRMPTTKGANAEKTTAEYGIVAMYTASRVANFGRPTRRLLAAEALRMSGAGYQLLVEGILESAPDLESGIRIAFAGAAEVLAASGYVDACWIETVALEVASTNEPLRLVTAEIFDGWIASASAWVEAHGLPAAEARALGTALITGLEGAFVLSRALRSPEPLHATGEMLGAAARAAMAASASGGGAVSREKATKGARR